MPWIAYVVTDLESLEKQLVQCVKRRGHIREWVPDGNKFNIYRSLPDKKPSDSDQPELDTMDVARQLWATLGPGDVTVASYLPGRDSENFKERLICRVHAGPPTETEAAN